MVIEYKTAAEEDEEEEDELAGPLAHLQLEALDPVRMGSIGCNEQEDWKR
jgi:hypothetical protein